MLGLHKFCIFLSLSRSCQLHTPLRELVCRAAGGAAARRRPLYPQPILPAVSDKICRAETLVALARRKTGRVGGDCCCRICFEGDAACCRMRSPGCCAAASWPAPQGRPAPPRNGPADTSSLLVGAGKLLHILRGAVKNEPADIDGSPAHFTESVKNSPLLSKRPSHYAHRADPK